MSDDRQAHIAQKAPYAVEVEAGKTYYGTGHLAQIADFAEAVRDRRPPFVTAESAAETLRTVFDIYDSARLGQSFR